MKEVLVLVLAVVFLAGCGGTKQEQQRPPRRVVATLCAVFDQARSEGLSDYQIFRMMDDNGDFDRWPESHWERFNDQLALCD